MKKLDFYHYPYAGLNNLKFKLKTGEIYKGSYKIITNENPTKGEVCTCARRWVTNEGYIFSSNQVDEWEEC